jgi:hypothetical protein
VLIALINQRQVDWWPAEFQLTIGRSTERDWVAIVDSSTGSDFANGLGQAVAELRPHNTWLGQ